MDRPSVGLSIEAELQADQFAFTVAREAAFARYTPQVTEFVILGCALALRSLEFIETTFLGLEVQVGSDKRRFPLSAESCPSTSSRLEGLLSCFPTKQRMMQGSSCFSNDAKDSVATLNPNSRRLAS